MKTYLRNPNKLFFSAGIHEQEDSRLDKELSKLWACLGLKKSLTAAEIEQLNEIRSFMSGGRKVF